MSDLLVFTTGTDTDLLRQSCADVNITLATYDVIGWKSYVHGKLREGIKFLVTRTEPLVMWLDGNDTLVLKPENEILARWTNFGGPVIMSAESTCWPDASLASKYKRYANKFPEFLNAGGFIGPRGLVLTAMHTALSYADGSEDDQLVWTRAYLDGALPDLQLDHARRIFASVGDGEDALLADSCTKHFNGRVPGRKEYYDRSQRSTNFG